MGRTKLVMNVGLLGSWAGQVPCVYLCTRYWRHDGYGTCSDYYIARMRLKLSGQNRSTTRSTLPGRPLSYRLTSTAL